jgi:hypothetical protein
VRQKFKQKKNISLEIKVLVARKKILPARRKSVHGGFTE